MTTLFDDLKTGLEEAIAYEKGTGTARVTTYTILPVNHYSREDIKKLRVDSKMTQVVFASFMGVSKKTVEAWENGRIKPSGSACRLMDILSSRQPEDMPFVKTSV